MQADAGRKTLLQFYDAVNRRELDAIDDLVADGVVDHEVPEGFPAGAEGVKQYLGVFITGFPDVKFEAIETVAEGALVCARARVTGTHEGEFLGIPATGRRVDIEVSDWVRFDDHGRALEHWGYSDNLKMMQQLGVIPEQP